MKRTYETPLLYIDRFEFEDLLTSSGIGAGDGVPDTLDDDPTDEPL